MRPRSLRSLFPLLSFPLLLLVSLSPIRSYDAFWHLATGRWILEHRALPSTDPFALASDPIPWHNGQWLFQILLEALFRAGGEAAMSVMRAVVVAILFLWLLRRSTAVASFPAAVILCSIAFAGADHRLGVRPELFAIVLTAMAVSLALDALTPRRVFVLTLLTIVWINVHPSALLAPVIASIGLMGCLIGGARSRADLRMPLAAVALTTAALIVNPWGWRAIVDPLRLTALASGSSFVNLEWLPSSPRIFPLLYLAIAGGVVFLLAEWRARDEREEADFRLRASLAARGLFFLLFTVLAIRWVRGQGYFFVTLPLLLAPAAAQWKSRVLPVAAATTAIAALLIIPMRRGIGLGADPSLFPVAAVRQLEATGLRGNIFNADQFGGYLIWKLGERRVLTDGRNELYRTFLEEMKAAREDSRKWNALFRKYDLTLAVEEFREGSVDAVNGITGAVEKLPPSEVYFPRHQWALVGFDDVAMIFARRDAYPPETIAALEYRLLVPEVPGIRSREAGGEIRRARARGAEGNRLRMMESLVE
ncbi:MAG TPA: hypothetical protein VM557_06610 [Thermoanaerobaculia bacterium]|nr:hypothetical protein [Thermoanaerobaculia bacterium]